MIPLAVEHLRALIVDDERLARGYLAELLVATGRVDVTAAVESVAAARLALAGGDGVDAVFVDVRLSGPSRDESGLTWVRSEAARAGAPLFVLATAFPEHAVEAFDLGLTDYLLKPFTDDRVQEAVRRLLARGVPKWPARARMVARRDRTLVFLELDQIWACEAYNRLTRVHSRRGVFELDLTLQAIEGSFAGALTRVHRNWLVRTAAVLELDPAGGDAALLVGDATADGARIRVPVARDRVQAVRDLLLRGATGIRR